MNSSITPIQSRSLNCCNCGAALAAADIVCPHCHSRNAVDLMAIKQFRLLEEQPDQACPNCSKPLTLVSLDDFNCVARHCTHCKGLFFGPAMLDTILQRIGHEVFEINHDRLKQIHAYLIKKEQVKYKSCPDCSALMWRKPALDGCTVIADHCREHGVWLDAGELSAIAEWLEAGGKLKVKEDEKIAAKVAEIAMPRPAPPPLKKADEEERVIWEFDADDLPMIAGVCLSALGFSAAVQSTHWGVALLALGLTAIAAWLTRPWFAGVAFGVLAMLYRMAGMKWPPFLALLVFIAALGALVVAYRMHLKDAE